MRPRFRTTLRGPVTLCDTGVRFGAEVTLTLAPTGIGAGLILLRTDLGATWPLDLRHSAPGPGCTISGPADAAVHFVEHVLAALVGCGVSDCHVSVDGPEIPLFDGSALPIVEAIRGAGLVKSTQLWEPITVNRAQLVSEEGAALCVLPGEPEFTYALAYEHPLIGAELASFLPERDDFAADLAPARTFITAEEAHAAQAHGLLAAGSEENAIVLYPDHISEEPTLPQPFARHKLLDLIGDLFLLGRPVAGRVMAFHTGHRHNHELARLLAAQVPLTRTF